jgi:hypothetical protein
VVDSLVKEGSDPSKPHSLEFVFRGDESNLQQMLATLSAKGYSLLDFSVEKSRLIMARSMPLDVGSIFSESIAHHENCQCLGVEYDGWGALVVA